MTRSWIAVALLVAACGKGKDAGVAQGSATGSATTTGSDGGAAVAVALPTVTGHGYEANAPAPRVSVTPSAIIVDGKQVLALEAGVPPAVAVQGETLPAVIGGLSAPSSEPRFVIALDKAIEYRLLVQLLRTLKTQGLTSYGLLAQTVGAATVMLPLEHRPRPPEPPPGRVQPGSDLQRQIDEVKKAGAQIKARPSGSASTNGGAPIEPSSASAMTGEDTPSSVVVEVRDATLTPDSSLSADITKAKISATYLPGLRRCVKTFAERDATTTSSFTLVFAISEAGIGVDAKATGVTADAADCIGRQAATWRFPIPKDADRKPVKVSATVTFDITVDESAVRAAHADMLPGPTEAATSADDGLGMAISITEDDVVVWSVSGLEGTLAKPRLRIPLASDTAQKLSALLGDIVKRRWTNSQRATPDLDIIVVVEPATKMQVVAELLGAVRATPEGTPLFPSVLLAVGGD